MRTYKQRCHLAYNRQFFPPCRDSWWPEVCFLKTNLHMCKHTIKIKYWKLIIWFVAGHALYISLHLIGKVSDQKSMTRNQWLHVNRQLCDKLFIRLASGQCQLGIYLHNERILIPVKKHAMLHILTHMSLFPSPSVLRLHVFLARYQTKAPDCFSFFLAFDFCRFYVVILFFYLRHNGQWPPPSKHVLSQIDLFSYLNSCERASISLFNVQC